MNIETLETKKSELESRYNDINKQMNDLSIELRRLEGEYRLVEQFILDIKNIVVKEAVGDKKVGGKDD
jgi:hypothetical protein